MDLFTHVALPLLLGRWLKRSAEEVAALAIGGLAPDLDIFLLPINWVHPNFFLLVHRGITHSLFFGFFAALLTLRLFCARPVRSWISQHFGIDPKFTRRAILFAYAGVLVHLALDSLTTRGVPLFFPLDPVRWSAEIFFYSETPLLLASLGILIFEVKRQELVDHRKMLLLLLLLFALAGTVRLAEKDRAEEIFGGDATAFPAPSLFEWTVLAEDDGVVGVYSYDALSGEVLFEGNFPKMNVLSPDERCPDEGLKAALDEAESLPQVRTFRWRAYDVVISAAFRGGGWNLEYRDPVMTARMKDFPSPLKGFFSGLVSLDVRVEGDRAEVRNGLFHV
jgi:inner membrane protein